MSQTNTNTNTNTNTGAGNINQSHNTGSGGREQAVSSSQGRSGRGNDCRNSTIARYSFDWKMKDGLLFKRTITEGGQRPTQYKKIIDALPVICTEKGYRFIDNLICMNAKLLETTIIQTYPDAKH